MSGRILSVCLDDYCGADLALDFPEDDPVTERAGMLVVAGDSGSGKTALLDGLAFALGRLDLLAESYGRHGPGKVSVTVDVDGVRGGWTAVPCKMLPAEAEDVWPQRRRDTRVAYFSDRRRARAHDVMGRLSDQIVERRWRRRSQLASLSLAFQSFVGAAWEIDTMPEADRIDSGFVAVVRHGPMPGGVESLEGLRRAGVEAMPVSHLPAGWAACLGLLCCVAMPLDGPLDVLLIDEIERHLHPTWHCGIVEAIRSLSPTTQIVATTHSPYILDAVARGERVELRRGDGPWDDVEGR